MAPLAVSVAAAPFRLSDAERTRLLRHLESAVKRARRTGRALAAVTIAAPGADPAAVLHASRRPNEPWYCLEQPDREGSATAALGCVEALEGRGPDRFAAVARRWRALVAEGAYDAPDGLRGAGPIAVGGFAFADDGGTAPHWQGFAPASMHVPEVALVRRGDDVRLTLSAVVSRQEDPATRLRALEARLAELRQRPLPLLDPDPATSAQVASSMPPEHYEEAVRRATERIQAGELQKVVLAREVQVHAGATHDPAAVHGVLREAFPSCYVLGVGRGHSTFLAASPELLVRRDGLRAGTLALAGSTRRSADPSVDDHLGEQLLRSTKDRHEQSLVTDDIVRTLRPHALWVTTAEEPQVVRMANIQHLATPIRAQLARPVPAIELAGLLHPTPAVGGHPLAVARPLIPRLEGLDRGWYAGPVGWTDANEDGEFCVALRCALLEGDVARCYAGVGVVGASDPAAELAETEVKLQALLPVLAL